LSRLLLLSRLLILHIGNLCILLGIHLFLLRRFRSSMMSYCIGSSSDHGGSYYCPSHDSSSHHNCSSPFTQQL
jgi:hypothetical protein